MVVHLVDLSVEKMVEQWELQKAEKWVEMRAEKLVEKLVVR